MAQETMDGVTWRLRISLTMVPVAGVLAAVLAGCGDNADPRFAAATYDEYTEPLVDAVISNPSGTRVVGAFGTELVTPASAAGAGGGNLDTADAGVSLSSIDGGAVGGGSPRSADGGLGGGLGSGGAGRSDGGVGGKTGADGGGAGTSGSSGFGFWHFDDCSADSHFLVDSSGRGANAQQALKAACEPGIGNLGVRIRSARDIIQVPDEPQFTVSNRIAVAAWVHPDLVTGNQPIVIKRLDNQTSFSLGIHNGNIEMAIVLDTGKTIISGAPISPGVWTHVAGMFDGTFVFLFINGQQFGQVFASGTLRNVFAPLRIGATTQTQFLHGIIDEVFVSTEAVSKDRLIALSCIARPSTIAVNPQSSGPTPVDTRAHFDIAVTDNDIGSCQSRSYQALLNTSEAGITTTFDFPPGNFQSAAPGHTVTFGAEVSGSEDAGAGSHLVPFQVFSFTRPFEQLSGHLSFELAQPAGCFVLPNRELMIISSAVVDDPVRAVNDGPWSFGHLLREMAPTPAQAPAFALQLFQHWLTNQAVNGFTVAARPGVQQLILDIWPKTPTGELDLDRAPFRLQAIVNRFDLRDLRAGSAGQERLVFALNDASGFFGQEFTVIFEYNLQATTTEDVTDWANRWHALSSHPFPSEEYNAALEEITRRVTERNAAPDKVNGSDLLQLRTNDFVLAFFTRWELREFELSATSGFFDQSAVKETPDLSFNESQTFADFVNQNQSAIIDVIPGAPSTTVPLRFAENSFRAGSVFNDLIVWSAPGIASSEARFHASLNTCNGCHGPETNTSFLMIFPRSQGQQAQLSPFLTGTTVFDPLTGQPRTLNDLARRKADLTTIVCPSPAEGTAAAVAAQ